MVPIYGKIEINTEDSKKKNKIILNHKKQHGYLIKPKTWCKIKFLTNHSILMVFCDREYEYKDYIEKYKDFLRIVGKKK